MKQLNSGSDATAHARILAAARREFGACGYAAASVSAIARAAGVTKPMIYYYFASKEGLFLAIIEAALRALEVTLREALDAGHDTKTRLTLLAQAYVAQSEHLTFVTSCMSQQAGAPPFDPESLRRVQRDALGRVLMQEATSGELRSLDMELFCAAFFGALQSLRHPDDGAALRAAAWVDLLWQGIARP